MVFSKSLPTSLKTENSKLKTILNFVFLRVLRGLNLFFNSTEQRKGNMGITGIDMIWLEVDSLQRSIEFYRDELGLVVDDSDAESKPPMASVNAGKVRIVIGEEYKPMITRGRGINLFFGVDDVDDFYKQITTRGFKLAPPIDEGWGGRFITVKDPDGYRLFFVTWIEPRT